MCEFHGSNSNGFGDIWWTDNPIYFSSIDVGPSLADNIPATDTHFSQYLSDSTNVDISLFLNQVTQVDMLRLVAQVKLKKSKGHDELDMCVIKKLIPYRPIVGPLKHSKVCIDIRFGLL